MALIGGLLFRLRAETGEFEADLGKAEQAMRNKAAAMEKRMADLERRAGVAGKAIGSALGAGVVASVGFAVVATRGALKAAAALDQLSQKTGVSVERLQTLQYAADQAGTGADGLGNVLIQLNTKAGQAINGNKELGATFRALGVDMSRLAAGKVSTSQLFDAVIDGLSKMRNTQQRVAVETRLFGEELGPKMEPMVQQGVSGIKSFEDHITSLGAVMSGDTVKKLDDFRAKLAEVERVLGAKLAEGVAKNAGAITQAADSMVRAIPQLLQFGMAVVNGALAFAKALGLVDETKAQTADRMMRVATGTTNFGEHSYITPEDKAAVGLDPTKQYTRAEMISELSRIQAQLHEHTGIKGQDAGQQNGAAQTGFSIGAGSSGRLSQEERDNERFNKNLPTTLFKMQAENTEALTQAVEEQWEPTQKLIDADADYVKGLFAEASAIKDSLDPMREYQREADRMAEMVKLGALSSDEMSKAMEDLAKRAKEAGEAMYEAYNRGIDYTRHAIGDPLIDAAMGKAKPGAALKEIGDNLQRGMLESFLYGSDAPMSGLFGDFEGILEGALPKKNGAVSVWVENQPGMTGSGGGGGLLGGLMKGIGGLFGAGFVPDIGGIGASTSSMLSGLPVNGDFALALAGGLAGGGPTEAGRTYLVGEHGPELFTAAQDGMVTANSVLAKLGGHDEPAQSRGMTQVFNIKTNDADSFRRSRRQIARRERVAAMFG